MTIGRRWRVWTSIGLAVPVLLLALILALILATLWLVRKPVATYAIDDLLARRGVPGRYTLARIGLHTQRLTQVSLGDPAHPDLVADWIEVDTQIGWFGVGVGAIRAGHVRLAAGLNDTGLTLGSLDRLLPGGSGSGFRLPAIDLAVRDARVALATPYGPVALTADGRGRLDSGFRGRVALRAPKLDLPGCAVDAPSATLAVASEAGRPILRGPVVAARLVCGGTSVEAPSATIEAILAADFKQARGALRLAAARARGGQASLRGIAGTLTFAGSPADLSGKADLNAGAFTAAGVSGSAARVLATYRYADRTATVDGIARATVSPPPGLVAHLARYRTAADATPFAALFQRLVDATAGAARSGVATAHLAATIDRAGAGTVTLSQATYAAPTGAAVRAAGAASYGWPSARWQVGGDAVLAGGGLPSAAIHIAPITAGQPLTGRAVIAPYAVGSARLALDPVTFTMRPDGATQIATRALLSATNSAMRVADLSVPLRAAWAGGRVTINPVCVPVSFARVRLSSVALDRAAFTVCPVDGAMLRVAGGRIGGGVALGPVRFGGKVGNAPLAFTADRSAVRLAGATFAVHGLAVRIGAAEHVTHIELAALEGQFGKAPSGTLTGGTGQIANVPLVISAATGTWKVESGKIAVLGGLTIADAAADPRFLPLAAQGVALDLAGSTLGATGGLYEPTSRVKVADVAIAHDLAAGTGHADLTVPGIAFSPDFQPERLTPLTFGIVANVAGIVRGEGHIRWGADGVTSDGTFRTAGIELAAAFGPVTGIATEIRFTDLLGLRTAPGQVATIRTINPGVPVTDGVVHYQIAGAAQVRIEDARWPFAGGSLVLAPAALDFGAAQARRLTFHLTGVAADQFLQQFDFKNLDATGIFDGTLPMVFDATGGRIAGGHLVVRPGGGTLAYVGEVGQKDLGVWGNFAFQALKSLRYRNLDIVMNGPLDGEMVTEVRFAGVGQGTGAKRNFILDRLQKLPIVFNVKIAAPFRQLIDSAQSFYDPRRLLDRPEIAPLVRDAGQPIQPPDSRTVP